MRLSTSPEGRRAAAKRGQRFWHRPQLEWLEDRVAPAVPDGTLLVATAPSTLATTPQSLFMGLVAVTTGGQQSQFTTGGAFTLPTYIVEDLSSGKLYVTDYEALVKGAIFSVDSSGTVNRVAVSGSLDGPNVLALVGGFLYVANQSAATGRVDNILKIDPNTGMQLGIISNGDNGTSTGSNTASTLNDTSNFDLASNGSMPPTADPRKPWKPNGWAGWSVKILSGTGAGQFRTITSNTATQLTLSTPWSTVPDTSSTYEIGFSIPTGMVPGPGNTVYLTDEPGNFQGADLGSIWQVDLASGVQTLIYAGGDFDHPVDLALSGNTIYVVNTGNVKDNGTGSLFAINTQTGQQTWIVQGPHPDGSPGGGQGFGNFSGTDSLDLAPNGTVFIGQIADGATPATILAVNPATGTYTVLVSGGDLSSIGGMLSYKALPLQATTTVVTSSANPSVFGQSVTFTATVSPSTGSGTPTGTVQFMIDSANFGTPVSLIGGVATSTAINTLSVAPHNIQAVYSGDTTFAGGTGAFAQTVAKASTSTAVTSSVSSAVFGQSITFTATVSVQSPGTTGVANPTGTVTFFDGSNSIGAGTLSTTSGVTTAMISLSTLTVASHTITASYSGDGNFLSSSRITTQTIGKATTSSTLSSSANPSISPNSITFTATVGVAPPGAGTPTGTVQFFIDGSSVGMATVSTAGGLTTASFNSASPSVGPHTVTATYNGDGNFLASNATLTQTVTTKPATTTVVSPSANPSVFGQSVTFTATVTASGGSGTPTGTVQFMVDGTSLGGAVNLSSGGIAVSSSTSSLSVKNHTIQAVYSGDSTFAGGSGSFSLTVGKASTSTVLSSSTAGASVFGQSVNFTATIGVTAPGAGTPTGTVQFAINGTNTGSPVNVTNSGGQITASFTNASLMVGPNTITASYSGDGNFLTSTATTLTQTVSQASTTVVTTSSANPSVSGQSVTFIATISVTAPGAGTPTGTVQFVVDGNSPSSVMVNTTGGVTTASFSTAGLTVGPHTVMASYSGDSNFAGSGDPFAQTVNKANTSTALSASVNPSVVNQSVTFTASVSVVAPGGGMPTGTVQFMINSQPFGSAVTLAGGVAVSGPDSSLSAGNYTVQAVYSGDPTFLTSTGMVTQVVNKISTTTAVSSSANPSLPGQSVTFTATVGIIAPGSGTPTGTVLFVIDGNTNTTPVNVSTTGGVTTATFNTTTLMSGPHTVMATYQGDGNFLASSGTLAGGQTVTSKPVPSIVVSSSLNNSVFGQSVTFTATVTAGGGSGTPTGTVQFMIDGTSSGGPVSLVGGVAASNPISTLPVNNHNIQAVYSGDSTFAGGSGSFTQTVGKASTSTILSSSAAGPSAYGQNVTFTATIGVSPPGAGTPTGTVQFAIDGSNTGGPMNVNTTGGVTTASFSIANLAVGPRTVSASYSGDLSFLNSNAATLTQMVNQATTTTAVVSSLNPSATGQAVTFTATISASGSGSAPSGKVQWLVDNSPMGIPVAVTTTGGLTTATFSDSTLNVGNHAITASYSGDGNYLTSNGSLQQTVSPSTGTSTTTAVSSSANPQAAGQPVSWTANVTAAMGSVNFVNFETGDFSQAASHVGGTIVTSPALSGSDSLQLQRSGSVANYEIRQSGTTYYNLPIAFYRFLFEMTANSGEGAIVNFQDTTSGFKAALHLSPTNRLLFYDSNGTLLATGTTTLVSGQVYALSATIGTGSNAAWEIRINGAVEMSSTANLGSTNNGSLKLGGNGAYTNTYYFDDVAINSQGYPGPVPTGTVQFMVDGNLYGTVSLSDGQATSTPTNALPAGNHPVTATYSGDSTYASSLGTLAGGQTITAPPSTTTTTVVSSASSSVFGQTVTFTATVSSNATGTPTGTVTFFDGSTSLGQAPVVSSGGTGTASLNSSSLGVGTHTITASYSGDSTFAGSSGSLTQTVSQASTSTAVVSSLNPSAAGQTVTFTATISASGSGSAPSGTVQWLVDNTKMGSPVLVSTSGGVTTATFSDSTLGTGTRTITASYSGDGNYLASNGSLQQTVAAGLGTTTTVTSSANPQTAGQPVNWTATVTAAGSVNFVNFETGDFSQAASHVGGTIVTSPALSGSDSLQLQRSGSVANYEIRQSGTTYYNLPTAYYRFLFETTANPGEGGIVNFQDTASGFKAALHLSSANKLLFYNSMGTPVVTGTTTLASGQVYAIGVMIGTGSNAAWQILINGTVEMSGTTNLGGNNNGSLKLGGNSAYTTTYYYDDVAINSQGYPGPVPTGTVQFMVDGSPYGSPVQVSDGIATSTPPNTTLLAGNHTVTAAYSGDSTYAASTGSLAGGQTINAPQSTSSTTVVSSASSSVFGQTVTFTATVSVSGAGTPTGTVTFFDGSTNLGQATLVSSGGTGTATLNSSSLGVGTHTITASYSGDSTFAGSSGSLTQTVSQASTSTAMVSSVNPSGSGQAVIFTATISASGSGSAPSGTVQWLVDNSPMGSPVAVTTTGGVTTATFSDSTLGTGTRTITASYSGDGNYLASNGSLQQTVAAGLGTTTTVTSSANPQTAGQPVSWTATVTLAGSVNFVNFETGDFSQAASHVGGTIVTSPALSGTDSLQLQRSGSVANYEIRQSGTTYYNLPTAYYRFLFETTANPGEGGIVNFQDTTSGFKAALHLSPTNKLLFFDSTGSPVATGTTTLASGQVYAISAMIGTGSNAAWQILINGTVEMSSTANLGHNNNGSLKLGGNNAYSTTYYYDDVAINSQGFPGPVPTGTVQFMVDGSPYGSAVPLSDGMATSTPPNTTLTVGNHTVAANYSGDSNYAPSSGALSGGQTITSGGAALLAGNAPVLGQMLALPATASQAVAAGSTVNPQGSAPSQSVSTSPPLLVGQTQTSDSLPAPGGSVASSALEAVQPPARDVLFASQSGFSGAAGQGSDGTAPASGIDQLTMVKGVVDSLFAGWDKSLSGGSPG